MNRYIGKIDETLPPKDNTRYIISRIMFRHLLSWYEIPPAFVSSMLSKGLTTSFVSTPFQHRKIQLRGYLVFDFIYMLPIRAGMESNEKAKSHALLLPGSTQEHISEHLNLSHVKQDIRRSRIAVFSQHDRKTHQTKEVLEQAEKISRWRDLSSSIRSY